MVSVRQKPRLLLLLPPFFFFFSSIGISISIPNI